jgi:hypothetical protein
MLLIHRSEKHRLTTFFAHSYKKNFMLYIF